MLRTHGLSTERIEFLIMIQINFSNYTLKHIEYEEHFGHFNLLS